MRAHSSAAPAAALATHALRRPDWDCTTCAAPWPCAPARAAMVAEHAGDSVGLLLRLARYLTLAVDDLPAEQAGELYARFISWARAAVRRAQTSAGDGPADDEKEAVQMQRSKEGLRAQLGDATWRKSTRSGPYSDNCVEVALLDGGVGLRDTKDNGAGPVLVFDKGEWDAFLRGAADGEFALS